MGEPSKVVLLGGPKLGAALTEKSFRVPETDFRSRLEAALRQRLAPNTNIQPKMLAYDMGVEERSVRNWLAGDNGMTGATLAAMVAYFADKGDLAFIGQVIGRDIEAEIDRRADQKARAIFEIAIGRTGAR